MSKEKEGFKVYFIFNRNSILYVKPEVYLLIVNYIKQVCVNYSYWF